MIRLLPLCILVAGLLNSNTYAENYPRLPKETLDRAQGINRPNTFNALSNPMYKGWAFANIGLFDLFTPLMQPINKEVKACSSDVVVAVIDTGVDYTHPSVKGSVWINKGEIPDNGIDDDGNGYIDDVVGWDFVHDSPLPYDTNGHGTHIAGIISAICPNASIMALKYYSDDGAQNEKNTIKAIQYATRMGANIINYSAGGEQGAQAERTAIEEAQKKGILYVAASGNNGTDSDLKPYYPAGYVLENIVSVASIGTQDYLLASSNHGTFVSIAAPGLDILSLAPGNNYAKMTGTSQTTAFVSGAAALIWSQDRKMDYKQVRHLLLDGARPLNDNKIHNLVSSGILSISGSIHLMQQENKARHGKGIRKHK